ncbi:MAG: twin-arginine translocase TatA/TatE family subunit [Elusimicrobiota bacterium]
MELIIILIIILLLFGPKRLPQLGKSLGKTVKAIREGVESTDADDDDDEDDVKVKASEPTEEKSSTTDEV